MPFGSPVGKCFLDDAAVAHGRKVVGGLPAAGIGFGADVDTSPFLNASKCALASR